MAEIGENDYQVILEKVPYDRQPDTALFLSGCFSLPPASTRGIAASGPIALLSDLTRDQAEAIRDELEASVPAGVTIRTSSSQETPKVSRLQWPRPPRVYGKDLADFKIIRDSCTLACPICGGKIRITRDSKGEVAADVPMGSERSIRRVSSRRLPMTDDSDPLFSGIKTTVGGTSNFVSLRALEAGDTGFWMQYNQPNPSPRQLDALPEAQEGASGAKKSIRRNASGLSAFMKPGVFAVIVGRTKEPQVVKMVADIMGDTEEEAREKCLSLGLCIARGISLDEAQNLLSRFKNLGARARIVKPM